MKIKNQVQLITYPDSLGGDLKALGKTLEMYFPDTFKGGIHILPPFPSSGDRGFAPITYFEIEPAFGAWEDIKRLGQKYDIMVDLMVNHISRQSLYFKDFLEKGHESEYADIFITLDKIWDDGNPLKSDLDQIFLRRKKPFSTYTLKANEEVTVWTTFGNTDPSEQIDLDINSSKTMQLLKTIFENFKENNIKQVRLDAVGYVIKKRGTSCFFVEPEIYDFLDEFKLIAEDLHIELLPEVHADRETQFTLCERNFWIYDFILPYTVLCCLLSRSSTNLKKYLMNRPSNQFTMLDCHDGIPVLPDMEGLLDLKEAEIVTNICMERGANISRIIKNDSESDKQFNVHQINGTFYSMLGEDDDAYLASRAIQFFAPGIPQVYYVGLLAGLNDLNAPESIGDGRAINRHNYSFEEIETNIKRDVVKRLVKLIKFRNENPAFNGNFEVEPSANNEIQLVWKTEEHFCKLVVDLNQYKTVIEYGENEGKIFCYHV